MFARPSHLRASNLGVLIPHFVLAIGLIAAAAGCSPDEESIVGAAGVTVPATVPPLATTTTTTLAPTTTVAPKTTTSTTTTTTVAPSTSTTTTTVAPSTSTTAAPPVAAAPEVASEVGTDIVPFRALDLTADRVELGTSVLGTPIVAERYGTPGGRRVLVIGVIHGNEPAGFDIVRELRNLGAPDGVELWLVDTMNPDGLAIDDRQNANQVDLNRNFPYKWGPLGQPGDGQYAGTGPASEPETKAMVNFIAQLRPDIAIWYHQDLYVISPSEGRDGRVRARYASLTGLPMGEISTSGAVYTGIAATWARRELAPQDAVAFIVELGPTLSGDEARLHAGAVLTVAVEG